MKKDPKQLIAEAEDEPDLMAQLEAAIAKSKNDWLVEKLKTVDASVKCSLDTMQRNMILSCMGLSQDSWDKNKYVIDKYNNAALHTQLQAKVKAFAAEWIAAAVMPTLSEKEIEGIYKVYKEELISEMKSTIRHQVSGEIGTILTETIDKALELERCHKEQAKLEETRAKRSQEELQSAINRAVREAETRVRAEMTAKFTEAKAKEDAELISKQRHEPENGDRPLSPDL